MTPGTVSKRIIIDRLGWVQKMLMEIRSLPLDDRERFFADSRNGWAAESCLRRALEALFDLGRHILAKGYGQGAVEYRIIAAKLVEMGVLSAQEGDRMDILARYRNRMVHFYHEITSDELYSICANDLRDVEQMTTAFKRWLDANPQLLDETL